MSNPDALGSIDAVLSDVPTARPAADYTDPATGETVTEQAVTDAALNPVSDEPFVYDAIAGQISGGWKPAQHDAQDDDVIRQAIIDDAMASPEAQEGVRNWERERAERARLEEAEEQARAMAEEIRGYIGGYLVFPEATREASVGVLTLWSIHTYAYRAAGVTPYLAITAPTQGSGKTTVLEVLSTLANNPSSVEVNPTAPVVRLFANEGRTLFLDEIDMLAKDQSFVGVVNSGYKAGGSVTRVGRAKGGQFADKTSTFCPKAFAGIAREGTLPLPTATLDRTVNIPIVRAKAGELARRFRVDVMRDEPEVVGMRDWMQTWTHVVYRNLRDAWVEVPALSSSRAEQIWEPMLAIADQLGGDWGTRARQWAVLLDGQREQNVDPNVLFVQDVKAVLDRWKPNREGTRIQVADLHNLWLRMDERTFPEALDMNKFSRRLAAFQIRSVPDKGKRWVRIVDANGDYLPVLKEMFDRYLTAE